MTDAEARAQIKQAKAEQKLAWINAQLDAGRVVHVTTVLRTTEIRPSTRASWQAKGLVLLKITGRSLYMARGRRFDCIDGCQISSFEEKTLYPRS